MGMKLSLLFVSLTGALLSTTMVGTSASARDFKEDWPPNEGDCKFCPSVLAAGRTVEWEWSVDHTALIIDEQIWEDLVSLTEKLIDKIPEGSPPDDEPPEEDDPDVPDGEVPDPDEEQEASGSGGGFVVLVDPVRTPQIEISGNKYFAQYELPKSALNIVDRLSVKRPVRLMISDDGQAAVIVPKGEYPISSAGILKFPVELREKR